MRRASLQRISTAAKWGRVASYAPLVLEAARHFSNVAKPIASNKTTRRTIARLIENILNELEEVKESTDFDLRVSLYGVLFNCCADTNDWARGSKVVAEAFQRVPASHPNRCGK